MSRRAQLVCWCDIGATRSKTWVIGLTVVNGAIGEPRCPRTGLGRSEGPGSAVVQMLRYTEAYKDEMSGREIATVSP